MTQQTPQSISGQERPKSEIAVEIGIAAEKVQFRLQVPTGPATWEDLLPFMRALVKVSSDIAEEHFATRGQKVSCRAGCGICCRQQVPLAPFEAHRLRRLVDELPEPRRSEITARFRDVEARVKAAGLDDLIQGDSAGDLESLHRSTGQYFRLMIPCPFLEDESCSIHDERPLKCREYLVTSPAEHCAEPEGGNVVGLPLPLRVYLTTLLMEGNSADDRPDWVPLNSLMSWTDSHKPQQTSRTGPELFQQFMSHLMQPNKG